MLQWICMNEYNIMNEGTKGWQLDVQEGCKMLKFYSWLLNFLHDVAMSNSSQSTHLNTAAYLNTLRPLQGQ